MCKSSQGHFRQFCESLSVGLVWPSSRAGGIGISKSGRSADRSLHQVDDVTTDQLMTTPYRSKDGRKHDKHFIDHLCVLQGQF